MWSKSIFDYFFEFFVFRVFFDGFGPPWGSPGARGSLGLIFPEIAALIWDPLGGWHLAAKPIPK